VVAQPSITETPWYWVYLFCTAGLVALVLMGPRYSQRQAEIERVFQGRQRAIQNLGGTEPTTAMSDPENTRLDLWPLYGILGVVLAAAWANLAWRHVRLRRAAREAMNKEV
jgi:hypothetical protein